MNQPLQDFSENALTHAIEENTAEFLLTLGRAGGGQERYDARIHWTIGGSPLTYHNCVVRANLSPEEADSAIEDSLTTLREQHVPGSWHVGPSMSPHDLAERLLARGFSYGGSEVGMAIALHALREDQLAPASLTIERVRDEQQLEIWAQTLAQGFGEGEIEAHWVRDMYRKLGLADDRPWRHYLGRLNGEAVATTSLFLGAGVAGIYFVFTLPQARHQGIGAAITLAALHDARQLGYHIGILGSSTMGYSVYRRIGFQDYCRINIYEWMPLSSQIT